MVRKANIVTCETCGTRYALGTVDHKCDRIPRNVALRDDGSLKWWELLGYVICAGLLFWVLMEYHL